MRMFLCKFLKRIATLALVVGCTCVQTQTFPCTETQVTICVTSVWEHNNLTTEWVIGIRGWRGRKESRLAGQVYADGSVRFLLERSCSIIYTSKKMWLTWELQDVVGELIHCDGTMEQVTDPLQIMQIVQPLPGPIQTRVRKQQKDGRMTVAQRSAP